MPYDPNQVMGLDALSPTVAAYKQFVERQNNVGDPNVVQFLASRGEPQLAGLIAKKMRVENAAKSQQALAQQPPAAPPTVADQYDQAAQQQAQQAMAAQMAQMQQARMAQAAPGLAGMPNPAMEQANFAGGGIVAFAGGGDVQHFFDGGMPFSQDIKPYALFGGTPSYNPQITDADKAKLNAYNMLVSSLQRDVALGKISQNEAAAKIQAAHDSLGFGASTTTPKNPADFSKDMGLNPPADFSTDMGFTQPAAAASDTTSGAAPPAAPARRTGIATLVKPAAPAATANAPASTDPYASLIDDLQKDKDKGEDFYIQQMLERNKQFGAGKAADEFEQVISKFKDRYEGPGADKANLKQAIVQFGASLMAGKGGFNAALGQAAQAGVGQYYAGKKENEKAAMDLAKSTFDLHQAKENLMLSAAKEGSAEFKKKEEAIESAKLKQAEATNRFNEIKYQQEQENKRAEAQARETAAYRAQLAKTAGGLDMQYFNKLLETVDSDTGKLHTPDKAYQLVVGTKAAVKPNTAAVSAARARLQAALNTLKMYQFDPSPAGKAAVAAANQAYMQAQADLEQLGGGSESATLPTTPGGTGAAPTAGGITFLGYE